MSNGRLRIFLGMCPGVGKTYAMLLAAQQCQENGDEVVIGVIETHGRIETLALSAGLRRIPPLAVEHRGITIEEMDLNAVLACKPDLVLVDELAHTNAPGSRHPKRYQDVLEILSAGIDVYTTLNVQHLESLRDAVAGITGVKVRETLPDSLLDRANEIELVDITPEQLCGRLAEGKVYLGDRAATAAEAFFREGNLRALREMALRVVADRADREVRTFLKENAIQGPWRSRERLMVAVGSSPHAGRLIRITGRLAGMLDATWIAVHVDTGHHDDDAGASRLAANLALARSLGGETISVSAVDPVEALLAAAQRENATQIVAGKATESGFWRRLVGGDIADRLARRSGSIDVLLVHPGEGPEPTLPPRHRAPVWQQWLIAAAILLGVSTVAFLLEPVMGYRAVTMLYMLAVAVSGLFLGPWPVVGLASGSALAWNFLFTQPRMTFSMWHHEDIILLLAFLIVAVIIGHQTSRLLRRERASQEAESRARALYELTCVLAASVDFPEALRRALRQITHAFSGEAAVLLGGDHLKPSTGFTPTDKELSVSQWAFEHNEAAGRFTGTLPEASILAIPLASGERKFGVLALRPGGNELANPLRRDLLDAFAAHLVVLIERDEALRTLRDSKIQAASNQLQRALLDEVSHELKTPVAVIGTAVERLRETASGLESADLLHDVELAARRLDRVTSQLMTLSRVQAGLVIPQPEHCDAHDLLSEIAGEFGEEAARIRIDCESFTFSADAGLLHTALANLVRNALQYSPATGDVILRGREQGNAVVFSVDDRGPGMPEDKHEKLFERFARGPGVTSPGMGLGLSIAKRFTEAIGGALSCENRDGGGTTFAIRLPRGTL
ncbi:MAG: sensor histidine kinase KdpD [Chthoniobacterales bacterium]|nr:sensor histidine kinase KdpD [Chthoniobacterales bacterium]